MEAWGADSPFGRDRKRRKAGPGPSPPVWDECFDLRVQSVFKTASRFRRPQNFPTTPFGLSPRRTLGGFSCSHRSLRQGSGQAGGFGCSSASKFFRSDPAHRNKCFAPSRPCAFALKTFRLHPYYEPLNSLRGAKILSGPLRPCFPCVPPPFLNSLRLCT